MKCPNKFREGDAVVLVQHETDSGANLEIGAVGKVVQVNAEAFPDGNQIWVSWEKYVISPDWYVHPDAISLYNVCLENK